MKKQKSVGGLAVAIVLFFSSSCTQNPYPQDGQIFLTAPVSAPPVPPPFVFDLPQQLDLYEGQTAEIVIRATVPEPGVPLVTFEDLPAGATFSPDTMTLTWTPSYEAGSGTHDPLLVSQSYRISAVLRSSVDPVTIVERSSSLVVHNTPRLFQAAVEGGDLGQKEGETIKIPINITSEDFPDGPFKIYPLELPSGAEIVTSSADPTKFFVKFTADYLTATVSNFEYQYSKYRKMKAKLVVENPSRVAVSLDVGWKVYDVRKVPDLVAPEKLTTGTDANFTVTAIDRNGEGAPRLRLLAPEFGKAQLFDLRLQTEPPRALAGRSRDLLPLTTKGVRWTGVPTSQLGKSNELVIEACVKSDSINWNLCTERRVGVTFSTTLYAAPQINRKHWEIGVIRYVRDKVPALFPLAVDDATSSVSPRVEILPVSAQSEITWAGGNIRINPQSPGFKQFTIRATSNFGVTAEESFLLEVLPANWSETLILGESHKVSELVKTGALFNDVQYANPVIQPLDSKLLSLRQRLVVTSSILSEPTALESVQTASQSVRDIFILSPLSSVVSGLVGPLAAEIAALKVSFRERFLEVPGLPELKFFALIPEFGGGLKSPAFPVRLSGTETEASKSPLFLAIDPGSDCTMLLTLRHPDLPQSYPLAVSCKRQHGGKLLIAGFEWADAVPSPSDHQIIKEWMQQQVTP